jgi:hypothetical protein
MNLHVARKRRGGCVDRSCRGEAASESLRWRSRVVQVKTVMGDSWLAAEMKLKGRIHRYILCSHSLLLMLGAALSLGCICP